MKQLDQISVQFVKGVGPAKKILFEHLGVNSVEDLLYFFPRRYQDRRNLTPIAQARVGEFHTITGKIINQNARKSWHTKKHVTEVVLDDGSGKIYGVWFNQPYLNNYLRNDKRIVCYGKVDLYKNRLQMVSPEYELIDEDEEAENLKKIVPIYPLTRGITQRFLRKTIRKCLDMYSDGLRDYLPLMIKKKYKFADIKESIKSIHFPEDPKGQEESLKRISFEEFFFFQVSVILRRLSIVQKKGFAHKISDSLALGFINGFDFELTRAQKQVIREIIQDMSKPAPMLRLLQGDVGSGKTLVAKFGCLAAFKNGYQSVIMAPTEILARQHFENAQKLFMRGFNGAGIESPSPKIALLTSSLKKEERDEILLGVQTGKIDIVIGTHALISEDVNFKNLSFVVIDEQHKFGVRQRALLAKKGSNPDVLIMTATPIPRTLCITLYGDLDVSMIDEMPKGRGEIKTNLFSHDAAKQAYAIVAGEVKQGRQAYVVYPIIEDSEKSDLKAAEEMFKQFKRQEFKEFSVALVHGQMKPSQAQAIMESFKNGEIDILVATTVLEVGIDVPNASVMLIEHAERFGLAQLHQLRGRIGRGRHDSFCLLVSDPTTEEGNLRLKAMLETNDGFVIAQKDLEIRGPGRYFGRHQHGLNELKVANPATQIEILELARKEALMLTQDDPVLGQNKNLDIKALIVKRYPTYLKDVQAG